MEDEKIIALLFARNEMAISALEQSHKAVSMSVAMEITANRSDAEECWSDTCLAVWNSIPPAHPASLRAYVLRIIRNAALNLIGAKQAQKRSAILIELDECITKAMPDMEVGEIGRAISAFLETLPQVEALIFMRRYFCSQAVGEIAKCLGYKENQISKILAKLRRKLKKHLTEGGITL